MGRNQLSKGSVIRVKNLNRRKNIADEEEGGDARGLTGRGEAKEARLIPRVGEGGSRIDDEAAAAAAAAGNR